MTIRSRKRPLDQGLEAKSMAEEERNDETAEEIEKQEKEKSDASWTSSIGGDVSTGGGAYIGRDFAIKGDEIYGDRLMGDKMGRDRISIGDIKGKSGVTIDRGAPAPANQELAGGTLNELFAPLMAATGAAPDEMRDEVMAMAQTLKEETARGDEADDALTAELIERLITMVPESAQTLKSIFKSPTLANQVGPVTSYVLAKIQTD